MSQQTITIQSVVNWASQHAELMPLTNVGGYTDEPALSIANDVLTELCSEPYAWKFNRVDAPFFVTQQNKQDYQFAGAACWTQNGGAAIALTNGIACSGTTATVTTIENHGFNVGDVVFFNGLTGTDATYFNAVKTSLPSGTTWSNSFTIATVPSNTTFTCTIASGKTGATAPGITDLSWLESAYMVNMNDTASAPYVWHLIAVRWLNKTSRVSISDRLSVLNDDGAGTITFRIRHLPSGQPYGVYASYQKLPPVLTAISTNKWTPFPDKYAFVYRQLFLAKALRYANSARADVEYQKAMADIAKALGADDREESEEYLVPVKPLMAGFNWGGWR